MRLSSLKMFNPLVGENPQMAMLIMSEKIIAAAEKVTKTKEE